MSSSTTLIVGQPQRGSNRYFQDRDGEMATTKREDEKITIALNWADQLASGETISSAAYEDSGVTRSSTSNTTTTTTTTVTGLGEFKVTVTLSTGRILQKLFRFYPAPSQANSPVSDYP